MKNAQRMILELCVFTRVFALLFCINAKRYIRKYNKSKILLLRKT